MKSFKYTLIGFFMVSLVFVACNSFAQMSGHSEASISSPDILAASTMMSSEINTREGNYLAEISDLVIDPSNGRISNVVLKRVPMMGAKEVNIPFGAVLRTGQTIFVHRTPEGVYNQFTGEAPYWSEGLYICSTEQEPTGSYRASKLIGSSVKTSKGKELGRIDDLGIDFKKGRVAYLVVSHKGMEGKIVPFNPPLKSDGNSFKLNITNEQFGSAPAYRLRTEQAGWRWSYDLNPLVEYNWAVNWPAGR